MLSAGGSAVEVRLLGPVQVISAAGPRDPGPPQRSTVLAALGVAAGRMVTVDTLIERVWGDAPADGARRALHAHVARLRRLLAECADGDPVPVTRRTNGYVLQLDPERVDVHRFRALVQRAGQTGRPGDEAAVLREALALWHGEPLAGLAGAWATRTRDSWRQEYQDAVLAWARAELAAGNPAAVVGPLSSLTGENPFWEPLIAVLMRALHAVGRQTQALDLYTATRDRLIEELGAEPGTELRQAHQAVLRDEPAVPVAVRARGPAQLPRDVRGFAGREKVIGELDALLSAATTAVVISAIAGTPGVGKTAVAIHWAHRVAARFPDGQLYLNLRGFDPQGKAVRPAEAVRHCLDALGVPAAQVPAGLDAQAALYRSLLAGKRMLIVLDNAGEVARVRPLLPGAPGCLVLVTSRNQLSGLVATDGAHPLRLDLLTEDESRELLARRLGTERIAAEPDIVARIVTRCAGLPLALAIVAARAAIQPHLPLWTVAADLLETGDPLSTLSTGDDPESDVRAVFSWSYRSLSPAAARVFRQLGLHPGPDVSAAAVATMTGISPVRPVLDELVSTNLLVVPAPDRYTFHDLLRAYAAHLTRENDSGRARRDLADRMLGHYLHSAYAAARSIDPHRGPVELGPPPPGYAAEPLADRQQAMEWFTAEHSVLLALIEYAAATGHDDHVWRLAWTMSDYLDYRGHWHDWASTQSAAVAAGERLGDSTVQARAHLNLSHAYRRLNRPSDTETHLNQALDLYRRSGDPIGQARTHQAFSDLRESQQQYADARGHCVAAVDLFRTAGHRQGEATALNALGWTHVLLNEYGPALTYCREALARLEELGDVYGQTATWDSLGYAHHHLSQYPEALACYRRAVELARELGDRYSEAVVLQHTGDTYGAAGDSTAARTVWQQALAILTELDHPDADQVRERLAG